MRPHFALACITAFLVATIAASLAQGTPAEVIRIEKAWARSTPNGATTGAAYMTIYNDGAASDRLVAGSTPYAQTVQIHEMTVIDNVMQMRQLKDGLAIPPHGSAVLKPGGYHVMLIGLNRPLKAGDALPLTLTFEKFGRVDLSVPIQNAIPDMK